MDALTVTGARVPISYLVALGCPWPSFIRVTVQGGDAHVVGDRVPCVLADVAVDPVPAVLLAGVLAQAPKRVRLAVPAPHGDPVYLCPVVSG